MLFLNENEQTNMAPQSVEVYENMLSFDTDSGQAGVVLWEWDFLTNRIRFSPEWRRMMVLEGEGAFETAYDSWIQKAHKDDIAEMAGCVDWGKRENIGNIYLVFRMLREDERWCWLFVLGRALVVQGKTVGVRGTMTDISTLPFNAKLRHGNMRLNDTAYQSMLENSPDLLVRVDRNRNILYANPAACRFMGIRITDWSFTQESNFLKLAPEHILFLRESLFKVFEEHAFVRKMVSFGNSPETKFTGEYSFWPEFDAEGNAISAMSSFRDLAEQVSAEKKAKYNAERLDALYMLSQMSESSEEEVMQFVLQRLIGLTGSTRGFMFIPQKTLDGPGRMAWVANGRTFFGDNFYLREGWLNRMADMGAHEGDASSYRLLDNGDGQSSIVNANNGLPVIRAAVVPAVEDGRIACFTGVANKVTDYVEADLQQMETFVSGAWLALRRHDYFRGLLAAKEAAEHANKVKDEFLANVSHELRTPLNGLLGMLQLLEYLPLSDEERKYIRAANLSGKALLRIISDILDFSRMERGKMELCKEIFDIRQTVCSTLNLFESEAEKRGLRLSYELDEGIPDRLVGDDARVRQIIFNLVGNSLKFTEEGSVAVTCRLREYSGITDQVRIVITVKDTGIGIPYEQQNRIFEAFAQVDSSSTRKYSGTGLGLGIVKKLVAMMSGSISLESKVGEGTLVACELEFERAPQASQQSSAPYQQDAATEYPLDILVAEDDNISGFAIRSFLRRMGHNPVCVSNGRAAVEALKLYPFHCLLTDIQMPDMDGLELVKRLRGNKVAGIDPTAETRELLMEAFPGRNMRKSAIDSTIPIVGISAHAMSGDKERFLKRGMNYYISKPIVAEVLAATLQDLTADLKEKGKLCDRPLE